MKKGRNDILRFPLVLSVFSGEEWGKAERKTQRWLNPVGWLTDVCSTYRLCKSKAWQPYDELVYIFVP